MSLRTRLGRLEQRLGGRDEGCPACRDRRGHTALAFSRRLPHGTTAPEGDRPAPCERCSDVPERIHEIVEAEADGRDDMDRLAAEGRTRP